MENANVATVREKIAAGAYENKTPYQRETAAVYRVEDSRLRYLFRIDLERENGMTGHSKADRLFDLAWEHGHSSGYSEVVNYYEDFVELVK